MKLVGAASQGSGANNEDACGYIERDGEVVAAWVLDGVTGINPREILPAASDAQWMAGRADSHLLRLAGSEMSLRDILAELVDALEADWQAATSDFSIPSDHDHPATCLILAKRYESGWKALRLGDSLLLSEADGVVSLHEPPGSNLDGMEEHLKRESRKRRADGQVDFKQMLKEFTPQHRENRSRRNAAGSHSILLANRSSLAMPELIELGWPSQLLLCTDGYYRAVDIYGLHGDASLMAESCVAGGVDDVIAKIRLTEAADPECKAYLRFKPADDATAVALKSAGG
jgi:hypothetical protein